MVTNMNKQILSVNLKKAFYAIIYGICAGIGINCFLTPNKLYIGGITGLSQLLSGITMNLFGKAVPTWAWILIFNIPLAIAAYIYLGKKFTVFSFVSIGASSLAISLIPVSALTKDPILAAVFGGLIIGFGTGLCFRAGFSTGGVDFIIFFIRKRNGQTVGHISLIMNGCIALAVGLIYGLEPALYSLIAIFINNKLLNTFYIQQNKVTISIFTKEREKVTEVLRKKSIHGVSYFENVYGGYTDSPISLVMSVISQYDLFLLRDAISEADPDAFINIQSTTEVIGRFNNEIIK